MRVFVGVCSALTILMTGTASAAPRCDDAGVKKALVELAWNNPALPSEVNAKFRRRDLRISSNRLTSIYMTLGKEWSQISSSRPTIPHRPARDMSVRP
jgi:hypothetical protein